MKTRLPIAGCRLPIEKQNSRPHGFQNVNLQSKIPGFTLIELLVVIAVIGLLAAFIFSVVGGAKRSAYISNATGEMGKIEAALERYHAAYGFYPPSGANALINPLYYELMGTTNIPSSGFTLIDGSSSIALATVSSAFGVSGFANCNKSGASGEDSTPARNFLGDLKANQIGTVNGISILVASVGGPSDSYNPLGQGAQPYSNPWRYIYPGTHNPNSYDLYVQLVMSPGKTNLICNWSKQVQLNSPLP